MINKGAVIMKINQDIRSQLDTKQIRTNVGDNQSFDKMVQSQINQLRHHEIEHIMREIAIQGEKLAHFRSVQDLVKFKRLVKGFLKETVYNGLHLQSSHSFNLNGDNRKLAIVKEVDEKLIELTEDVMSQEEKTVDLLGIIGEIKGLLINLYT